MATAPRKALTPSSRDARFFLAPDASLHRQYEALRCFFVEGAPSHVVAHRFGYSSGAFRVLCHQFRHDPTKRAGFFQTIKHGPQTIFFTGVLILYGLVRFFRWLPPLEFVAFTVDPMENLKQLIWPTVAQAYYISAPITRLSA